MSGKNAICFVESPLQLLNVRECIEKYEFQSVKIIIRCNPSRKENELQLRKLSTQTKLFSKNVDFEFIYLTDSLLDFSKEFLLFIRKRHENNKFDYCVLGDLRIPWMRRYGSAIKSNKFIVLDDGMASLLVRDEMLKNGDFNYRDKHSLLSIRGAARTISSRMYSLFSKRQIIKENIEIFSAFIEEDFADYQVVKNEFKFLSRLSMEKESVNEHWYFGSPLSERGIVDVKVELQLIQSAANHFKGEGLQFYYYAHRDDGRFKLESLKNMNIDIVITSEPAELMLALQSKLPKLISASGSSVLITFSYLLSSKRLLNFAVPRSLICEKHREHRARIDQELSSKYNVQAIMLTLI